MVQVQAVGGEVLTATGKMSRLKALDLARATTINGVRCRNGQVYSPTQILITVGREELFAFGGAA